jgi:hypothetical protein
MAAGYVEGVTPERANPKDDVHKAETGLGR